MYKILLTLCAFSTISVANIPNDKFSLNTWLPVSQPDHSFKSSDVLISKAFQLLDIPLTVTQRPAERSIREANAGVVDGEYMRIDTIASHYRNLVKVPQSVGNIEFVAFSQLKNIDLSQGWESLKNYSIGYVNGWKIIEQHVANFGQTYVVGNSTTLFTMLAASRFDIAIYSKEKGLQTIVDLNLRQISQFSPALSTQPMYLFVHKKHRELVPHLANAIAQVKSTKT